MDAGRFQRYVDRLSDDEALALHRIVCRRAARIYAQRYKAVRDANFRTAMAIRDTRFVKGLSPIENMRRSWELAR